jgi:serine/threonine protein kinase
MFEDISRIGKGTYGTVYRAKRRDTGEIVALKQIEFKSAEEGIPCTILRETSVLARLKHKNIVSLLMTYHTSRHMTMMLEYCKSDLNKYMQNLDHLLPPNQVIGFARDLLNGVAEMHSKFIIHRDIKTKNLLIGQGNVLKLCDFGLARVLNVPHGDLSLDVVTLWYRAPEILLRQPNYSFPSDMWSVGCVIYEMATKKPLFTGNTIEEQLTKIFSILGVPTKESWPGMDIYREFPGARDIVPPVIELRDLMAHCDRHLIRLVEQLLQLNPAKRLTAQEALQSPLFM